MPRISMMRRRKTIHMILKSLKQGAPIFTACGGASIDVATFWRWRQNNPRLDRLVEAIYEGRVCMVEDALFVNCIKGNERAQEYFLENRGKNWHRSALIDQSNHKHYTVTYSEMVKRIKKDEQSDTKRRPEIASGQGTGPSLVGQQRIKSE